MELGDRFEFPLGVLVANEAVELTDASPVFLRDFACAREDIVGLELSDLISPQDRRSTMQLDRALSQADVRRVDLVALLEVGDVARLSRLTMTRDGERWLAVVEPIDRDDNLVFELYNDRRRWSAAIKGSSDGVVFLDRRGTILDYNARFLDLLAFRSEHGVLVGEEALVGAVLHELLADRGLERLRARLAALDANSPLEPVTVGERTLEPRLQPLLLPGAGVAGYAVMFRDLTDRLRVEQEREQRLRDRLDHQDAVIAAQQRAIRELTAPLIPVSREITIVPFVGPVDGARLGEITGQLLAGITGSGTRVVVIDLTGVPGLDAAGAAGLVRLSAALRLLGVRVVLTGLGPAAAVALSETDALRGLDVRGSLQDAITARLR